MVAADQAISNATTTLDIALVDYGTRDIPPALFRVQGCTAASPSFGDSTIDVSSYGDGVAPRTKKTAVQAEYRIEGVYTSGEVQKDVVFPLAGNTLECRNECYVVLTYGSGSRDEFFAVVTGYSESVVNRDIKRFSFTAIANGEVFRFYPSEAGGDATPPVISPGEPLADVQAPVGDTTPPIISPGAPIEEEPPEGDLSPPIISPGDPIPEAEPTGDITPPVVSAGDSLPDEQPPEAGPWTPASKGSTASAWFDASGLAVTTDLADWPDLRGGNSWTQATAGLQPDVVDSNFNSLNSVSFDADEMELAAPASVKAMLIVVRDLSLGSNPIVSSAGNNPTQHLQFQVGGGETFDVSLDGANLHWGGVSINGDPNLAVGTDIDVPNESFSTVNEYIVYVNFDSPQSITKLGAVGAVNGSLTIAELLFWEQTPSLLELQRTEGYASHKWDATLDLFHPFVNDAPIEDQPVTRSGITNVADLRNAVEFGDPGDLIVVEAGTYILTSPLFLQPMQRVVGAGDSTRIENDPSWGGDFSDVESTPVNEVYSDYLFRAATTDGRRGNIELDSLFMTGLELHGALYVGSTDYCIVRNSSLWDFGWSAVRDNSSTGTLIEYCVFRNAAKKRKETGGTYLGATVEYPIYRHNIVETVNGTATSTGTASNYVGFKSDGALGCIIEDSEFLNPGFAIEVPHKNNAHDCFVRRCILNGACSLPKHSNGGGKDPTPDGTDLANNLTRNPDGTFTADGALTWHFDECYWTASYGIEGPRIALVISNSVMVDGRTSVEGNFVTQFDAGAAVWKGPVLIHDSRFQVIRGLWNNNPAGSKKIYIENNLIVTIAASRNDGIIGEKSSNSVANFQSWRVDNNIIDASDRTTSLFRNSQSYQIPLTNNQLINISDSGNYPNPQNADPQGPITNHVFKVGVDGRWTVVGWDLMPTP